MIIYFSKNKILIFGVIVTIALISVAVGTFNKESLDLTPIIKPTLSDYVVEYVIYTSDDSDYDYLPYNPIIFLGEELEGPFDVYNSLYIKKDWSYGLDEEFPEILSIGKHSSYKILKKVYRPYDFLVMLSYIYRWSLGK